jgi:glycosyltransferase involved in cell wall biosynthesis
VVSDTGGLSEIVEHDVTGVKVYPDNPDSLAWGITKVLLDEAYANCIKMDAYKKIHEKYDWDRIAQQTKAIYDTVLNEYSKSTWT